MRIRPNPDSTSLEAAALWCRNKGGIVGLTSGTFDLLHDFHLRFLKQCRRQCDTLVVGVDSDRLVRERKGAGRPIQSEWQREMLVNALKYVDFAFILDTLDDYTAVAEGLDVHRGFVNQTFEGRKNEVAVGRSGAEVIIIPDVIEHNSSSQILARILDAPFKRP